MYICGVHFSKQKAETMKPRQLSVIFPTLEKVKALLEKKVNESPEYITELWKKIRVKWVHQKQGALIAAIAIIRELSVKEVFESIPYAEEDAIFAASDFRMHYDIRQNGHKLKPYQIHTAQDNVVIKLPKGAGKGGQK
jgi:hypothetical protein